MDTNAPLFYWVFFSLAGNEKRHKIFDEFDFVLDRTNCF